MTLGKLVLKLLKYVKSAIIFFYQSEATFRSHMTLMESYYWLKFFIADLTYINNSKTILTPGQILIRLLFQYFSQKTHCQGQTDQFFHVGT